jgi:hypothetical protein
MLLQQKKKIEKNQTKTDKKRMITKTTIKMQIIISEIIKVSLEIKLIKRVIQIVKTIIKSLHKAENHKTVNLNQTVKTLEKIRIVIQKNETNDLKILTLKILEIENQPMMLHNVKMPQILKIMIHNQINQSKIKNEKKLEMKKKVNNNEIEKVN